MKAKLLLAAVLGLLSISLTAAFPHDYSTDELLNMTLNSLSFDMKNDKAFVTGVGIIAEDSAGAKYSARRAAVTDAKRGLLLLKISLKENRPPKIQNVSGFVPPIKILSENINDNLYFVEAETSLSALLKLDDRVFHGGQFEF